MSELAAVNEAAARAAYKGKPYVVVYVRGKLLVVIDDPYVIPHGAKILERCLP